MTNETVKEISKERRFIEALSDEQLKLLIDTARRLHGKKLEVGSEKKIGIIPQSALDKLQKIKSKGVLGSAQNDDTTKLWCEYIEKLQTLEVSEPRFSGMSDERKVYKTLVEECRREHLPESFAREMVSSIIEYIKTGTMKPVLLQGPAGSGKTTGAVILARIMGLKHFLISATRAEHGHGLYGEGSSYKSPDLGELMRGVVECESLNPVFIIDEVEKVPEGTTRASLDDQLLTVLSDPERGVTDNFLGFSVSLKSAPVIMTCNDLDKLSEPFKDRCVIYNFSDVELDRMIPIITDYAEKRVADVYKTSLSLDTNILKSYVSELYLSGVRSVRRHQQLIDTALKSAYRKYLESDVESVDVDSEHYESQMAAMKNQYLKSRQIGF